MFTDTSQTTQEEVALLAAISRTRPAGAAPFHKQAQDLALSQQQDQAYRSCATSSSGAKEMVELLRKLTTLEEQQNTGGGGPGRSRI
jgi:hypothetical protein